MIKSENKAIRSGIASLSGDISNDAVGAHAPRLEDIYAPEAHASALDLRTPVVVGSRGAGKSFWAGVLGASATKAAADSAYPRLGLKKCRVFFGYTGVPTANGVGIDAVDEFVPNHSNGAAKVFWWATVLRGLQAWAEESTSFQNAIDLSSNWERRNALLQGFDDELGRRKERVLIVFDALDTLAIDWGRRRALTEALLSVVWATRAFQNIHLKLFLRPDQIDDDALRFVELPKLRTGAVRLSWSAVDLYGMLFARIAGDASTASVFRKVCKMAGTPVPSREAILRRSWALGVDEQVQVRVMEQLAGPFMAAGPHGYKKGKTYYWPLKHLADAFDEVTPRSFLGLFIAAAKMSQSEAETPLTPEGLRHGLRAASRTRVDQLHQEFPWIKGVLAPLAGLLLPQEYPVVYKTWKRAKTVEKVRQDARVFGYLPPFDSGEEDEAALFAAMERIGVMNRRKDDRLDMPDLFRVAAKLLKKGGTAPV